MDEDAERVPLAHDLPDDLRDALTDDSAALASLYNGLQRLDEEAFADRFGGALAGFRDALDGREGPHVCVLGLDVERAGGDREVAGAAVASVHRPGADGDVTEAVYAGEAPEDEFLLLPVHADDCPPGSGRAASDLDVDGFREIVAAMTYQRFDLLQNDLDTYRESYLRPLVRGVEVYAAARDG